MRRQGGRVANQPRTEESGRMSDAQFHTLMAEVRAEVRNLSLGSPPSRESDFALRAQHAEFGASAHGRQARQLRPRRPGPGPGRPPNSSNAPAITAEAICDDNSCRAQSERRTASCGFGLPSDPSIPLHRRADGDFQPAAGTFAGCPRTARHGLARPTKGTTPRCYRRAKSTA